MKTPIVNVMPVSEALEYFQKNANSEGQYEKARKFATADFPKLFENKVETENRVTVRVPFCMKDLMANDGEGVGGRMMDALAEQTKVETTNGHGADLNPSLLNPKGYLCDAYAEMVGMDGPCNLLFAIDALNKTSFVIMRSQHVNGASIEIENAIKAVETGEASQWLVRATSCSSWRHPESGKLLSTQLIDQALEIHENEDEKEASSSSSASMGDDELVLLNMQEEIGRLSVTGGIQLPTPESLLQGKDVARRAYDILGAVTPATVKPTMFTLNAKDDHVFVLAHSVLGMSIIDSEATLCYYSNEPAEHLPVDEFGYVLRVPKSVATRAYESVLAKAKRWETFAAHRLDEMRVRVRPATTSWRYDPDANTYSRGDIVVPADQQFHFNVRLCISLRHYYSKECVAVLPNFRDVWPRPVFRMSEVNTRTGIPNKDAQNLVRILDDKIAHKEEQLEILSQLTDEQVVKAMSEAGVAIDDDGEYVDVQGGAEAAASSESTSAVDDD